MYYPRYKRVNNLVDLIVTFGEKKGADSGKFITLSNGVDFSDIPLKKPAPDYDVLNLIGVARLRYWHGYDRVIKGLERYYRDNPEKKVYFHIVGDGPELPKLKRLTEELRMEEHVIFHGLKGTEQDIRHCTCCGSESRYASLEVDNREHSQSERILRTRDSFHRWIQGCGFS
jgi:glycosyltransferase involved in cell wall biosynthesis